MSQDLMKKISPPIYRLTGFYWGWMNLGELAEILGCLPSQVVERYGALSKDAPEYGMMAVTLGEKIENRRLADIVLALQMAEASDEENGVAIAGQMYVPAGWGELALEAFEEGYKRVQLEDHYFDPGDKQPKSWRTVSHKTGHDNRYTVAVGYQDLVLQ